MSMDSHDPEKSPLQFQGGDLDPQTGRPPRVHFLWERLGTAFPFLFWPWEPAFPHLFERCGTNLYQISIRCRPVREKLLANHRTASDNRSEKLAKNDITFHRSLYGHTVSAFQLYFSIFLVTSLRVLLPDLCWYVSDTARQLELAESNNHYYDTSNIFIYRQIHISTTS